jgi:hypothetical protein
MTDSELLARATRFSFANGVEIVASHVRYNEGYWYIRRGGEILHPTLGWKPFDEFHDGSFLFKTATEAIRLFESTQNGPL